MKKVLALVLAAMMLVTVFAGCTTTTPDAPAVSGSDGQITLTVWESANVEGEFMQRACEEFTKIYPHITVEYVNVESGDSTGQIALDGPAMIGPDLFVAPHDKLGELVTGGHVVATADVDNIKAQVLSSCADACTYEGTMYGYPISSETYTLFYNKDLVKEVPKTWSDVAAFCNEFNGGGKYGFMFQLGAYQGIMFTTMNGNKLFGESGTDVLNNGMNSDDAIAGMKFMQEVLAPATGISAADMTYDAMDGAFASGTCAMIINGPWALGNYGDINYGVTALPTFDDGTPTGTFSGVRCCFVSNYSENKEAAALFGAYLVSDEAQQLRYEITGALPSIALDTDDEASAAFIAQLENAYPMPSIPAMGAFWDAGDNTWKNIWDGADVKTEMAAFDAAIQAAA